MTISQRFRYFFSGKENGDGQVMVEFAIIFPMQLVFTFGLLQLVFLMVSSLMVNYTVVRCTRAAVVGMSSEEDLKTVAKVMLSPLAFSNTNSAENVRIPGWGDLRGSGAIGELVELSTDNPTTDSVEVSLTFYQPLIFPFVDGLFALMRRVEEGENGNIFAKEEMAGRKCFPITRKYILPVNGGFDVSPDSDVYEYTW